MPASCANAFSPTIALFGCGPKVMIEVSNWLRRIQCSVTMLGLIRQHGPGAVLNAITISSSAAVPGSLADAVDGALDLPRAGSAPPPASWPPPGPDRRGSARSRSPCRPAPSTMRADQRRILVRNRITHRIRQIHRPCPRLDHRLRYLLPDSPDPCASRLRPKTPRLRSIRAPGVTAATASSSTCCRDFFSLYFR